MVSRKPKDKWYNVKVKERIFSLCVSLRFDSDFNSKVALWPFERKEMINCKSQPFSQGDEEHEWQR